MRPSTQTKPTLQHAALAALTLATMCLGPAAVQARPTIYGAFVGLSEGGSSFCTKDIATVENALPPASLNDNWECPTTRSQFGGAVFATPGMLRGNVFSTCATFNGSTTGTLQFWDVLSIGTLPQGASYVVLRITFSLRAEFAGTPSAIGQVDLTSGFGAARNLSLNAANGGGSISTNVLVNLFPPNQLGLDINLGLWAYDNWGHMTTSGQAAVHVDVLTPGATITSASGYDYSTQPTPSLQVLTTQQAAGATVTSLTWTNNGSIVELEAASTLAGPWKPVTPPRTTNANWIVTMVTNTVPAQFFRLHGL